MPRINPTVTGPRILRLCSWCLSGLSRVPTWIVSQAANDDMVAELTEIMGVVNDPVQFGNIVDDINAAEQARPHKQ